MTPVEYCVIAIISCLASMMGAIVGGAALLIIPLLLFFGVDPSVAIASTRVGAVPMMLFSLQRYRSANLLAIDTTKNILPLTILGGILGALSLIHVPEELLNYAASAGTLAVCFLSIFSDVNSQSNHRVTSKFTGPLLMFLVGFWASFYGGGWAVFGTYVIVRFYKTNFLEGAAILKIVGLFVSVAACIIFSSTSLIDWQLSLLLCIAMGLGGYLGTSLGIFLGEKYIKVIFIVFSFLIGTWLGLKQII